MPSYATVAEFEAYIEGWQTTNATVLARILERASRDVDRVLGPLPPLTAGTYAGLKVDPTTLLAHEAAALSRATCAQAYHRILRGEGVAAPTRQPVEVAGPDFTLKYNPDDTAPPKGDLAPAVRDELAPLAWLRQATARARV